MKRWLLGVGLLLANLANAQAEIITQWNFNSTTPDGNTGTGTITPNIGSGTAALFGGTTASFASGDASGGSSDPATGDDSGWNVTTFAPQSTENLLRGVRFDVSTAGQQNIIVNYDLRHSNTSSRFEQFQYSIDGTNFINSTLFDGNAGDRWFNNRTVDLSSVAEVNNNSNFAFRVVAAFDPGNNTTYSASSPTGTYGGTGTWRFDMVTVTAVPEPTSIALLSLVGVGGFALRRWRKGRAG
jgi:hypothetical protein